MVWKDKNKKGFGFAEAFFDIFTLFLAGKRFVKGAFSFRDKICPPHWITIAIRQLFPIGSHIQNVGQCLVGRALMRKGGRLDKINMRLTDPAPKGKSEGQMKKCKRRRPLSLAPAK